MLPGDMLVVDMRSGLGVFVYANGPGVGNDGFFLDKKSIPLVLSHTPAGDGLMKAWYYVLADGEIGWMCEAWIAEVIR